MKPMRSFTRRLLPIGLWFCLASMTTPLPNFDSSKAYCGRGVDAPEGSRFVQVREHEIFGIRVTEVVLGPADLEDELPMLVHFHGRGDRPHLPTGDHAGTPATRLIYPWAPEPLGDGYTWFPLSVTDRSKPEKVLGHHIMERSDQLAKVLDGLAERRPTRGRPFVTGFSQGGMMSFALALRHPEHVDGSVPVAGWLPPYLVSDALRRHDRVPPIRAMHGRGDRIVKLAPTVELVSGLRDAGVDASLEVFEWNDHSMNMPMHHRHRELLIALMHEAPVTSGASGG